MPKIVLLLYDRFLMIISLIVIAVFLYIITIQKLPNYAVLRVQGIANKVLIQNTIGQSFILVITGLIIGALLTFLATALVIPTNVPMTFDLKFLSLVSVGLMLTSVLGSLIPVRAILRIDPSPKRSEVDFMSVIEFKNVNKYFGSGSAKVHALKDINFQLIKVNLS